MVHIAIIAALAVGAQWGWVAVVKHHFQAQFVSDIEIIQIQLLGPLSRVNRWHNKVCVFGVF